MLQVTLFAKSALHAIDFALFQCFTGGCTIKFHKLQHISSLMMRLGCMHQFDSNFYESDHRFTKALFNQTSKRNASAQLEMVRCDAGKKLFIQ